MDISEHLKSKDIFSLTVKIREKEQSKSILGIEKIEIVIHGERFYGWGDFVKYVYATTSNHLVYDLKLEQKVSESILCFQTNHGKLMWIAENSVNEQMIAGSWEI